MSRFSGEATLRNSQGLHARPSMLIVQCAHRFSATTHLHIEDRAADCRSIMEVMMLASPKGTKVCIEAEGDDAESAVMALITLIEGGFGEAYS